MMVATATVLRQAEQLLVRERSHRWLLFMYGFLMLSLTSNCRNICQATPDVSMLALFAGKTAGDHRPVWRLGLTRSMLSSGM